MRRTCPNQVGFHSHQGNVQIIYVFAFALLFCIEGCGGGSSGGQSALPPTPTFTTIDAPGAGTASGYGTLGLSISPDGAIAGTFFDANGVAHGFIRTSSGSITTVDAPDAATAPQLGTSVEAINASGSASGYYVDSNRRPHSFIRASDGTLTEFDPPNSTGSGAFCINDNGVVAGGLYDANGQRGFVRGADGTYSVIDPTGAESDVNVVASSQIDSGGAVAGIYTDTNFVYHGFLRDPSGAVTIIDAPGAGTAARTGTEIADMNTDGVIVGGIAVGVVNGVSTTHSFMRAGDGTYTSFDPPQAVSSFAEGINDNGVIVGDYLDANLVRHGYIRQTDRSFVSFDEPNAAQVAATSVDLGTDPRKINLSGEIVGFYSDSAGVRHAFLRH
jgi:hypothetical protein